MTSNNREAATDRLDAARSEETTAAKDLEAVRGTNGELPAQVRLRAAETEVSARSAWLAWTDESADDR